MKLFSTVCLLLLLLPLALPAYSQAGKQVDSHSFTYQYLTTKEGLSNQRVFSILQDQRGFIWISTKSGVDCYNGRTVKNYTLFGEDIIGDGIGRMLYLTLDAHQTIWAYTSAGKIFRYDPIADTFILEMDVAEVTEAGIFLNQLFIDSKGQYWLGLKSGLLLHSPTTGTRNLLKNKCINSISYSPANQNIYIATTEGLYLCDKQTTKSQLLLPAAYVQSVFYDNTTHYLWIGTFNAGMKVQDTRTGKYLSNESLNQLPQLPYRSIVAYDDNTLLLGKMVQESIPLREMPTIRGLF